MQTRHKTFTSFFLGLSLVISPLAAWANHYSPKNNPQIKAYIQELSQQGLSAQQLETLFSQVKKRQDIIDLISRPAEKVLAWHEYRQIFVTPKRISQGKEFMQEHQQALAKAEQEYGVPAEIIAAIIGVETSYGRNKGRHKVIEALTTLSFDYPPRQKFFKQQLTEFLLLTHKAQLDPLLPMGSYAGAMGYPQFMPTSYTNFAIDFDGDKFADIWTNPVDAIGSVANYFKAHGWQANQGVLAEVASLSKNHKLADLHTNRFKLLTLQQIKQAGMQPKNARLNNATKAIPMAFATSENSEVYYLGLENFYVITRYNHSRMYALAVYQLAQELKK